MKPSNPRSPLEDVLDAFAVEQDTGRATLERYLRDYPEYAVELVDLSRELARSIVERDQPLSSKQTELIDQAWKRHVAAASVAVVDLFAALSVAELRAIAERLDVPRQIVTAFRERRVEIASVPRRFLARLAAALNSTVEKVVAAAALPPAGRLARSYKADAKPGADSLVPFERLLADAGVSDEKRATLMADDE